jgi:hypothetical protein
MNIFEKQALLAKLNHLVDSECVGWKAYSPHQLGRKAYMCQS